MPETDPILEELRQLAVELAKSEDEDIRGPADQFCREYRGAVQMIHAIDTVDKMTKTEGTAERLEARLQEARVQLRDRLRRLLEWGRSSGRIPS